MKKNKILIFIVIVTAIVAVIRTVSAQNQVKQLKREAYGGSEIFSRYGERWQRL